MNLSGSDWTYLALPVLGDPDPADRTQSLPVVRWRKVYLTGKDERADRYAIVELQGEDPIRGTELRWDTYNVEDWGTAYFVFKRTKEAAPGDAVVVLHEHKLTVRHYEPQENGLVCLRSVEQKCPTWILSADEVNIQGVVVKWGIDLHDSGWA
jgi:hypothetical protein